MNADVLREAAELMEQRAKTASAGRWESSGLFVDCPTTMLAVAAWLRGIADRHGPSEHTVGLYLHMDTPCQVCEDGGHESTVCEGCWPSWEGMDGHTVYPCAETKAALAVARTYLRAEATR